ncbi:MAG: hypothetical protein ACRDRG_04235 [Pseudonocardiaceae bacterium]
MNTNQSGQSRSEREPVRLGIEPMNLIWLVVSAFCLGVMSVTLMFFFTDQIRWVSAFWVGQPVTGLIVALGVTELLVQRRRRRARRATDPPA